MCFLVQENGADLT